MGDPEKTLLSDLRLKDDIAIQNLTKRRHFWKSFISRIDTERDGHTKVLFKANTVACCGMKRSLAPVIL